MKKKTTKPPRVLMWGWSSHMLHVLIPKRIGPGLWLRMPVGPKHSQWVEDLETLSGCDVCGLDGTMDFDTGSAVATYDERRRTFEALVFPVLCDRYSCQLGKDVGMAGLERLANEDVARREELAKRAAKEAKRKAFATPRRPTSRNIGLRYSR